MSIPAKKVQKKSKSDHSVFRKQVNNKNSLNKQNSSAQEILSLHQTLGNQAVQRLFESGFIQGKLTIGKPNDKYEQEADRVADEVMRMPEPQVQRQSEGDEEEEMLQTKPIGEKITPLVQRQVEPEEEDKEEEMVQTKPIGKQITPLVQRQVEPEEEEEEPIQAKSEGQIPQVTPNFESQINALQGGGQPLPKETRSFFEPRFGQEKENNTGLPDNLKNGIENLSGHSMDDVKVHYNSSHPAQLNAHAFAKGSDIHLASGAEKYLPHEAWHVVQQKQGRVQPTMQMREKVNINDDEGLEKEADVMGERALGMKDRDKENLNFVKLISDDIQMKIRPRKRKGKPKYEIIAKKLANMIKGHQRPLIIVSFIEENCRTEKKFSPKKLEKIKKYYAHNKSSSKKYFSLQALANDIAQLSNGIIFLNRIPGLETSENLEKKINIKKIEKTWPEKLRKEAKRKLQDTNTWDKKYRGMPKEIVKWGNWIIENYRILVKLDPTNYGLSRFTWPKHEHDDIKFFNTIMTMMAQKSNDCYQNRYKKRYEEEKCYAIKCLKQWQGIFKKTSNSKLSQTYINNINKYIKDLEASIQRHYRSNVKDVCKK